MVTDHDQHVPARRGPRRLLAAGVAALALGVPAVVAATAWPQNSSETVAAQASSDPGATTATTALQDFTAPEGMVAVVDASGKLAGFVPDIGGVPELDRFDFGTKGPKFGQAVVDANGNQTGYFIANMGFVTVEQAADPVEIDRLTAEYEARRDAALAEEEDRSPAASFEE